MFPDVTVFWVVFLILLTGLILNGLIVRPILRVMAEREGAVKSARELAESAAAQAKAATAEFEARTQAARNDIYREMDEKRRRALARRAELLGETRARVEAEIVAARDDPAGTGRGGARPAGAGRQRPCRRDRRARARPQGIVTAV